ncbi:TPA: hypothetical protein TXJ06_002135 [Streptococcus suis]|nr:hypothetical protein [Streptococcus suis]HEL1585352.1 hypothetical protein [Streptococcus suis]
MYKVQNSLNYRSWEVDSRDDLLAELEHLNARRNPLDQKEDWDIFYLSEQGELLQKTSISFPFQETIDELLADFGYAKPKPRKSFFSSIFGRKKEKAIPEAIPEPIQEVSEVVVDKDKVGHLDLESILEESALPPQDTEDESLEVEAPEEEEEPLQTQTSPEPSPEEEDSIFHHVAQPKPEKVAAKAETKEVVAETSILPEEEEPLQTQIVTKERTSIMKVTSVSDVESLSVSRLQSDMELTLTTEIEQIDALIARLQEQRKGHLHLLEHLQQFKLN